VTDTDRDAETIIADYLGSFAGGDAGIEHWRPHAATLVRWLTDEGWTIVRQDEDRAS